MVSNLHGVWRSCCVGCFLYGRHFLEFAYWVECDGNRDILRSCLDWSYIRDEGEIDLTSDFLLAKFISFSDESK